MGSRSAWHIDGEADDRPRKREGLYWNQGSFFGRMQKLF